MGSLRTRYAEVTLSACAAKDAVSVCALLHVALAVLQGSGTGLGSSVISSCEVRQVRTVRDSPAGTSDPPAAGGRGTAG